MTVNINLSWICCPLAFLLIMAPVAIFSTRRRLRHAGRIRAAMARGAFDDMKRPEVKSKMRWLGLAALVGVTGFLLLSAMGILYAYGLIAIPRALGMALFIVAAICALIGAAAGVLMQREIQKRL